MLVASDSLAQVAALGGGALKASPTSNICIPFNGVFADTNGRALIHLWNIDILKFKARAHTHKTYTMQRLHLNSTKPVACKNGRYSTRKRIQATANLPKNEQSQPQGPKKPHPLAVAEQLRCARRTSTFSALHWHAVNNTSNTESIKVHGSGLFCRARIK